MRRSLREQRIGDIFDLHEKARASERQNERREQEKKNRLLLDALLANKEAEEIENIKKRSKKKKRTQKHSQEEINISPQKRKVNIGLKDLMIRKAVFKCIHNHHNLQDIDACLSVIDKNANVKEVTIAAGYCEECKICFLLESAYQKLKSMGIPMCKISDEKNYIRAIRSGSMPLAFESPLMQYGYNVSQIEGLSDTRRQKILAVLIDNNIMTKSEIVSYIDFFINQKKDMSKFKLAIAKWEMDREFVYTYKTGTYSKYKVHAIVR